MKSSKRTVTNGRLVDVLGVPRPSKNALTAPKQKEDSNNLSPKHLGNEAREWIVGPMPPQEFLDDFLPSGPSGMPSPKGAFKKVPTKASAVAKNRELSIYDPIIQDINENKRCPNIVLVETSVFSPHSDNGSFNPKVCAFEVDELPTITRKDRKVPADLGMAESFFEVKLPDLDPFIDPSPSRIHDRTSNQEHSFISSSDEASEIIGQNVTYANEALARQHRLFYFSVMIFGDYARFVRWDRAGAIVTRRFNYKAKPEILCKFLWKFSHANAEQRGYDPTVSLASEAEEGIFRETIRQNIIFQLGLDAAKDKKKADKEMEDHYVPGRVTKMNVYDEKKRIFEHYIVSRPIKSPRLLVGRSTRCYWAARLEEGPNAKIAFLKDIWRLEDPDSEREGDIYDDLHENEVPNVSEVFCHGDLPAEDEKSSEEDESVSEEVRDHIGKEPAASFAESPLLAVQTTKTDLYVNEAWSCKGGRREELKYMVKYTHNRMTMKKVGYSIERFRGSRQLFNAASDVVDTIVKAHQCKRLHRDISTGNIILFRGSDGVLRAILIDWEYSTKTGPDGKARDYCKVGTWAFMSVAILDSEDEFRHSVEDDLESAFYCVLYLAVRSLQYTTEMPVGYFLSNFFDERVGYSDDVTGGRMKKYFISRYRLFTDKFKFDNEDIQGWFSTAFKYLSTPFIAAEIDIPLLWEPSKIQELFSSMREKNLPECDREDRELLPFVTLDGHSYYQPHLSSGIRPKDITLPAAENGNTDPEPLHARNKRSRLEINKNHGGAINDEPHEHKRRKGRECATSEDIYSSVESGRRITRSATRRAAGGTGLREE